MAGHAPPEAPVDATIVDRHERQLAEARAFDVSLRASAAGASDGERRWAMMTIAGCGGLIVLGLIKALKGGGGGH